jgi:hypothetical protein
MKKNIVDQELSFVRLDRSELPLSEHPEQTVIQGNAFKDIAFRMPFEFAKF